MTTPNSHRASGIVKAEINKLPAETRLAHVRYNAAKGLISTLHDLAASELLRFKGGEDLTVSANSRSDIIALVRSEAVSDFATVRIALEVIESSPAFKDAERDLIPLLDELEAAENAEAAHAHSVNQAKDGLRIAEEEAKAKAIEASANDSAVIAARKTLETKLGKVNQ